MTLVEPSSANDLVRVEQMREIEVWAESCDSIPDLQTTASELEAFIGHLQRTSQEGCARVAATQRRIEVQIGRLSGPTSNGERHDLEPSAAAEGSLSRHERSDFRSMAADPEAVEDVIAESTDEQPASRRKVTKRIKKRKRQALTPEQQREVDIAEGHRRAARAIERFGDEWSYFRSYFEGKNRDEIEAHFVQPTVERTQEIEEYIRGYSH